jgi:hypothetical protein
MVNIVNKKRILVLVVMVIALLLAFGSQQVLADQSYHTERLALALTDEGANEGHTLRNGQVINIHPNGPVNGAIEKYVLNGVLPDTEYEVYWDVQGMDEMIPIGVLIETDNKGNANYTYQISRQWQEEMGFTNVDFTVKWVFKSGGVNIFTTDFTDVHVD